MACRNSEVAACLRIGDEALAWQKRFLDHFLKGIDNGMDRLPQVRLEVRKAYYQQTVRPEQRWPLASAEPTSLHLCANTRRLQPEPVASQGEVQYLSTARNGKAVFSCRFERRVELIGSMRLRLWVSTSEGDDLDLFVVLRKLDSSGNEVFSLGLTDSSAMVSPKAGYASPSARWTHRALRRCVHGTATLACRKCVPATSCPWKSKSGRRRRSSRLDPLCS